MPDNPISNSGVSPAQPVPPYGPDKPRLGAGEEAQEPKPFTLGPEGGPATPSQPTPEKPTPMDVAGDAARQQPALQPEQLRAHIVKLQGQLNDLHDALYNPAINQKLVSDHYEAIQRVTHKMNPDMQNIAKYSNGAFDAPQQTKGGSVLDYITQWINGSQGTLGGALNYLQTTNKPDITSYLRLQYAVQRATQKGELFASIVGSSVSGIKTLMSTQLG